MAVTIPLEPARSPYYLSVTLGKWNVEFFVRWNRRDGAKVEDGGTGGAWYFDLKEEDGTLIVASAKIVLGSNIGRLSNHAFFDDWLLRAQDAGAKKQGEGKDATFEDIGIRVLLFAVDLRDPLG
jgi:hypothetical protein